MTTFQFLLYGFMCCVAVYLLSRVTEMARDYRNASKNYKEKINNDAKAESNPEKITLQEKTKPTSEGSFYYWLKELVTARGLLGLLLTVIEVPILLFNSYIIAIRLEAILGPAETVLGVIDFCGISREVTFFDILGALISICQMVSAEVFFRSKIDEQTQMLAKWTKWLGGLVLLILVAFEVMISACGGWVVGGVKGGFMSGTLALGICGVEVINGIFILHCFATPILLILPTAIVGLGEAIYKMLRYIFVQAGRCVSEQARGAGGLLVGLLAAVDTVVMEPMRKLDAGLAAILKDVWARLFPRRINEQASPVTSIQ